MIKMKLQKNRGNLRTLKVNKNIEIAFSYWCPIVLEHYGNLFAREHVISKTTRAHQNKFLEGRKAQYLSDDLFDQKLSQLVA